RTSSSNKCLFGINHFNSIIRSLPVIAQVSLAGNAQNAPPTLKDLKFWNAEEKNTQKIDRLARSLLIQGLPNDIYSLIDSNETAKDLWDALERQMRGFEYGEQDRKAYGTHMRKTKNLMDISIDALYNILKQNQGDVNDALGYKKKVVVVTSDPLALVAEKTNVKKQKEKVVVSSDSKGSDCKKVKVKDYNYYKTKMLLPMKDSDEQVLLAEDQAWMESSSDYDQEINANMVFMAQIKKVLLESDKSSSSAEETIIEVAYYTSESESESEFETSEYYDNSTNYGLFVNNDDDQEIFHDAIESASENFIENHIDYQKDYDHNDSQEKEHLVDKLIQKFNHKIAKCQTRIEKANQQSKDFKNQNKDLQEKYDVLINQVNTFKEQNNEFNEQIKVLNEKSADLLDQAKLVEMNNNVLRLQEKILEKETKISDLEGCVSNKDVEIEKCLKRLIECENKLHKIRQTNQTIHMIMPSKDTLYNGRKGIGFENPSYFEKEKDLRPSLYDEKVIGLGYTLIFFIHSDEALEIEKFKRARENKIEFAYNYGNLNASYVNEKINFSDDYFQEIINPDFEKIDSSFQQTSSLKPYIPNVILEKIIIDLENEVVSLLEKKANLKTIESLKSKGFESSENAISETKNQSENDCQVVQKECGKMENPKVIAPGMFKLSMSQSVSPISMSKTSCDSKNIENLDTFSSVRRPKHSSVIWKKKKSSNTSHVDSYSVSHLKLNKDVKRYSRKDLMCDVFDDNNFFIFDGESVRISPVSKMPFRKKPRDSMNVRSKNCPDLSLNHRFGMFKAYDGKDGVDLLTGDRSSNLYTIALNEVASNSSTYLIAKAYSSQSWLWHQRLSHLNFATINNIVKNNLVQ
nr:integrase, catalytic region, zinc finger, CCHC-type, peptidase aspartic, catalytic [Tanacetum cinerariifolium]